MTNDQIAFSAQGSVAPTRGSASGQSDIHSQSGANKEMTKQKTPLSEQEIAELILKYRVKARKLARCILRQWHSRLDLEDVDSVVDLSLVESARRFDPSYGASFMTFLYFHLRGNLIRAVSEAVTGNGVIDADDEDTHRAVSGTPGTPTPRTKAKVARASDVNEVYYNSAENTTPDDLLQQSEIARITREACEKLDPLEREIIVRIFLDEQQLVNVAESLGFSRCHISRLKKRALEALALHLSSVKEE
jgi:RNA polymerase sigma factor (sigma-70 family)